MRSSSVGKLSSSSGSSWLPSNSSARASRASSDTEVIALSPQPLLYCRTTFHHHSQPPAGHLLRPPAPMPARATGERPQTKDNPPSPPGKGHATLVLSMEYARFAVSTPHSTLRTSLYSSDAVARCPAVARTHKYYARQSHISPH